MELKNIGSYDEMLRFLKDGKKNYVLLYKKGTEASDCSYKNVAEALDNVKDIQVAAADVSVVRDIHGKYSITSAPTLMVFDGKNFVKTIKGCNENNYYKGLFEDALFTAKSPAGDEKPQKRVTVYSTPTCTWCNALKTHLKTNGIRFTDVDVSKDQKAAEAMVRKSGQQGVPQTDINGQIIVGFDKPKINTLLGIQ